MILLGLDPHSTGTLAVFVDEHGRVLSRSSYATLDAARDARHDGASADATGIVNHGPGAMGTAGEVNPGAAIALAESWTGAAKDAGYVVGLSLESSIHAGVVMDGRLFSGAHGLASTAGWLALNPVEREDYRKLGCLEAEVGEAGIIRRLVWRIKAGDNSRVLEMAGGNLNAITMAQVFEAARQGDGVAISVVRDTAKYIAMAVANFVAILDPDVVVLGGSLADANEALFEPVRSEMSRRIPPQARQQVSIVPVALGQDSSAIGAARAALLASRPT